MTDTVPAETPLRALDLPEGDGCRRLSDPGIEWLDGGEEQVRRIVAGADDLSSLSDELAAHDATWETRYHLSRERSFVMRALQMPADARVLEIGAGCGAVTRYLGETAATVDALEPMPQRAAVARLRCRDLAAVEVFVGDLQAVPAAPAYDLVVLVGVLEYVGGRDGLDARVAMLRQAAQRLVPGGAIACAIENRLGVSYLAGALEEHVARPFEGLEEYPHRGPARTFARQELEALFRRAGLVPRTLHVFPDYKFARFVYDDGLLASPARPLAWRVAPLPSAASPHPRPRLASEPHLWRGLVRAGLGGEHANSLLVVATSGDDRGAWPAGQLGIFFSARRRAAFVTETRIADDGDDIALVRRRLGPAPAPSATGLEHHAEGSRFNSDEPLLERLEQATEEETRGLLRAWREHVEALATAPGATDLDAGPHHALLGPGGELAVIDREWLSPRYGADDVVARGLLHLALLLAHRRPPTAWPEGCRTVGDLVTHLAGQAGAAGSVADRAAVVRREAELLVEIERCDPGDPAWAEAVERQLGHFTAALDRPLAETALGRRDVIDHVAARAHAATAQELDAVRAAHAAAQDELVRLRAAHAAVVESRAWRLVARVRRLARRG